MQANHVVDTSAPVPGVSGQPSQRMAEESIEEFKERSRRYEKLVADVTLKKGEVRAEIASMEIELR